MYIYVPMYIRNSRPSYLLTTHTTDRSTDMGCHREVTFPIRG